MKIVCSFKKWTAGARSFPLSILAAAIAALLIATPAGADTIETSLPPAATAAAVSAEPPPTSGGSTSPESSGAAPESVSPQGGVSVSPSPEPSVEINPDVPEPSSNLASTPAAPSADAVALPATSADAVTTTVKKVSVPAEVESDATAVPVLEHGVSKLAGDIDRNLTETITPVVDRLPATRVLTALQPTGLLDSVAPAIAAGEPPSEPSPASGVSRGGEARSFPPEMPRADLFLEGAVAWGPSADGYLTRPPAAEIAGIRASSSSNRESALSPAGVPGVALAGTSARYVGSPAPAEVPLPAPASPATAVPDSGGTSFVPIVALLALLALVAPTATRRLGMAPNFRAPTPFVCALERPG